MAQIGTTKIQTENNGAVEVPVFEPSDFGDSVYDMVRVQTANGIGAIPLCDPANASRNYYRYQTQNHGILAVHNVASLHPSMVEDFDESYQNGENLSTYYSGNVGNWSINSGGFSGNNLESHTGASSQQIWSLEGDGLPYYPQQGNTISFNVRSDPYDRPVFCYGVGDVDGDGNLEGYGVTFALNDDQVNIVKFHDLAGSGVSTSDQIATASQNFSDQIWYEIEIIWGTDGSHDVKVYRFDISTLERGSQVASVSATDNEFSSGRGIGFDNRTGDSDNNTRLDRVRVLE